MFEEGTELLDYLTISDELAIYNDLASRFVTVIRQIAKETPR